MQNFSSRAREQRSPEEEAGRAELFHRVLAGRLSLETVRRRLGLTNSGFYDWLRSCRRASLLAFDEQLRERLSARGAPAEALNGALFSGNVRDLAVADLLQLFELTGKSAVLSVTNEGVTGRLWCSAGAVIDAECGPLSGELAAYRMLGWEQGSMLAELQASDRTRAIHCSAPQLLLEAARRKDECARLHGTLGDEQRVLQLVNGVGRSTALSQAERVLSIYFEAPRSLGEVLAYSPLGDLETLLGVQTLLAADLLIEVAAPPQQHGASSSHALVRATPDGLSWRPQRSSRPRWALDAVSSLLLIPAASWLGTKVSSALTPSPPHPRPHSSK
ncbi:MAG: hypothetical protein RL033_2698 [Pseudomonadota bacterium]|jgi:hypothetical protein